MASRGKKKTTFAKLARESKLRERRIEKQAKKDARKRAALEQPVDPGYGEHQLDPDSGEQPIEPADAPHPAAEH